MKNRIVIALLAVLMLAGCGRKTATAPSSAAEPTQQTQISKADAQAVYQSLAGDYQDSVSQRAMMNTWLTNDGLGIRVSWASSAFQVSEWNMTAVLTEDNRLSYTDGTQSEITYLENNGGDAKEIFFNQKGYFTIEGGKLLWNGAADEGCKACVFERVPDQIWEPEYAGIYRQTWREEIAGTVLEMNAYIVLNADKTGYWIAQDVGTLTWNENQLLLTVGEVNDIALTQENGTVKLLVYRFQDDNGVWTPSVFEKIEKLPAEIEEMLVKN